MLVHSANLVPKASFFKGKKKKGGLVIHEETSRQNNDDLKSSAYEAWRHWN